MSAADKPLNPAARAAWANNANPNNAPGGDWQALGRGNRHNAFQIDTKMSVSIAPKLGVNWMTNLLSPNYGGPTIAFNPTVGKTLVYSGDERGNLAAYDESTGQTVWSTSIGTADGIYSTPTVSSDESSVWFGTVLNPQLWKLNAATGAAECSVKAQLAIQMSPTEGISSKGKPLIYFAQIHAPNIAGPEQAINEADCSLIFSSNPYKVPDAGSWASPAYGVDKNGRRLVFQGTADPDSAMYAMDATTGALDWSFSTGLLGDSDIGAAATVSAPGNNGFASGVLYFIDKSQVAFALNLTTGAQIWSYDFGKDSGTQGGNARSAAALDGNTIVFGMADGVYALNATTGAKLWHYTDPASVEVISNPAIVGPLGKEVVAFGDLAGAFHVLSLATGAELYHYQTGNYITGSPSYVNGHFLIASTDGFLYDFAAGGGNAAAPQTAISSPRNGGKLPYLRSVTVKGTATDAAGVNAVQVAVQSGGPSGPWYNIATNSWGQGARSNLVAVANPGAKSATWTFTIPVPTSGAALHVFANAVNVAQQADRTGQQSSFSVAYSPSAPHVATSAVFIAPATSFNATGSGFSAGETVSFSIGDSVLGSAKATQSGTVSASLKLPAAELFGAAAFTATGETSRGVAVTPIDIANDWLQAGNGPAHTGFEPNDTVFGTVISPGNNNYLAMAWYYAAGAAVESSPSVSQAQIFFGNDAGTVAAVQTDTAAPVWSVTIPSGAAVRSTPAIDPSTGDLTFTADDGVVYVVATATGTTVGSTSIGGLPTSPTVNDGAIFVGSDNATLSSIAERTGTLNWTRKMAAAVHATPALDATANVLVTGDDSGAIRAFNSKTGTPLWQVTTGGPVTAAPTIVDGIVFVGSSDGKLYALKESSGAKKWAYASGTALTTAAVFDSTQNWVYAGGANGTLYAIDASQGFLNWSTAPKKINASPYVGISAAKSLVFADVASGSLVSFRSSQAGRWNSNHTTAAALTTAPAVNDGTVYVGASDGGVYAYTTSGALPQVVPQSIRRAAKRLDELQVHPASRLAQSSATRFSWLGQRDVAIHVDTIRRNPRAIQGALTYHGGPVQSTGHAYAIFWKPAGAALEANYIPAATAALRSSANMSAGPNVAGTYVDTTPYPAQLSDGAIQTEIARAIAANHWSTGVNSQFIVLTTNGAVAPGAGFCSYHSAFALGHDRSKLVVYAMVPYSGAVSACATPATLTRTGDPAVDAVTGNLIRVERELINDPLLNGWHNVFGDEVEPAF